MWSSDISAMLCGGLCDDGAAIQVRELLQGLTVF